MGWGAGGCRPPAPSLMSSGDGSREGEAWGRAGVPGPPRSGLSSSSCWASASIGRVSSYLSLRTFLCLSRGWTGSRANQPRGKTLTSGKKTDSASQ